MATRSPNSPTYKAAFSFVAESGARSTLYDAGDFSPYAIESLVDTLRGESRKACRSLELTLEIGSPCSASTLAQLRRRFRTVSGRDVTVRSITTGH